MITYLLVVRFEIISAGVSGLSKYLRSKYSSSWKPLSESDAVEVDHVCIDMNQILHTCIRGSKETSRTVSRIFSELDSILRMAKPRKSLVLAFDGFAPYAKMLTQRSRRFESSESLFVTPGTDLMESMNTLMLFYALQRSSRPAFKNVNLYISDPSLPGEGEIKIIDWLNGDFSNSNDSIIICGADSDILLLALAHKKHKYLTVIQDNIEKTEICNITSLLQSIKSSIYQYSSNANLLQGNIKGSDEDEQNLQLQKLSDSDSEMVSQSEECFSNSLTSLELDLVLCFGLQGNDYLPKLRQVSMEQTLVSYAKVLPRPCQSSELIDFVHGRRCVDCPRQRGDSSRWSTLMPMPLEEIICTQVRGSTCTRPLWRSSSKPWRRTSRPGENLRPPYRCFTLLAPANHAWHCLSLRHGLVRTPYSLLAHAVDPGPSRLLEQPPRIEVCGGSHCFDIRSEESHFVDLL